MADNDASPAFTWVGDWSAQLVATAIHTGHDLRDEVRAAMALDEETRLREEDPFTDLIGAQCPARVVVHRSRFEVDLNRARDEAVYRRPEDAWDLEVWRDSPLPDDIARRSTEMHDAFYAELGERLDEVAARGPFVVYDVHSYNHRRDGEDAPEGPQRKNPEVNVGTGPLDRERWGAVVDVFIETLAGRGTAGGEIDVRENVRFEGAHLSRWVDERYEGRGIALALEFKKTYMDEWTGEPDHEQIDTLARALGQTVEPVLHALRVASGARDGGATR
ncbi:N-formylglutamate amidohydrolase [Knoellia sinensis KCTC 19936]|uniref:N-formylglutamate amidohydrolase n=1 Tax=Knoellia sinensis KCTC 19936 TaxID=1385520 RepID=A0A0A0JBE4_9MICO|nr:N-formylglutamate amidohydrolase [Knoellia sinensis]KGN32936.1 N-formylglutamate amidohydrolase [Knoellia sinensis KCTC 19936]